ncbi:alpha/beta fold hydrolase [Aeromonas veronii]
MRRNQVMKFNGLALRSAGEGPLLLLLHGLGSSSLDWQAQIERFSEHYRVVALDLRGHGQSMQEGPFDVATLAADVVNWLDEQPEPAWVVGLSLGAMVALELALQLPHKVQGLVLVNGFSEFLLETPKEQERYAQRLKWLRWFGMRPSPGGWDASSSRARIWRRCATPSGCVSCAIKRKPTRRCWRRYPAGRYAPGLAPSGSRWPSSPPVTTTCRWPNG